MRIVLAALAGLALAACEEATHEGAGADVSGYVLEVRTNGDDQLFVVTAPDGRVAGGRAADGASMFVDGARAQTLLQRASDNDARDLQRVMGLQLPGFDLAISGDPSGAGDTAKIDLNVGGRRIEIDAQDSRGEGGGRAVVRITGADEAAARDFIREAEGLSGDVRARMLSELGLQ